MSEITGLIKQLIELRVFKPDTTYGDILELHENGDIDVFKLYKQFKR